MEDTNEYFNMALARFVKNFACGDEIRAKYKNGKSVKQIKDELTTAHLLKNSAGEDIFMLECKWEKS